MRDLGVGIRRDIFLDLVPVAAVVPDFFAPRADGQQTLQRLDLARQLPRPAQRGQRIGAHTQQGGEQAESHFLRRRDFAPQQTAEHTDHLAGDRQRMPYAPLRLRLPAQRKKHRRALPQGEREPPRLDLAVRDVLQDHPVRLARGLGQLKIEIPGVDGPKTGPGKKVQPADVALADGQNPLGTGLRVEVAAEMFERREQRRQFMLRVQPAQLLQAAAQKIGINGIELLVHGRLILVCLQNSANSPATLASARRGNRFSLSAFGGGRGQMGSSDSGYGG